MLTTVVEKPQVRTPVESVIPWRLNADARSAGHVEEHLPGQSRKITCSDTFIREVLII